MEKLIDRLKTMKNEGLISFNIAGCRQFMPYQGNVQEAYKKVSESLTRDGLESDRELYLFTHRLLVGIIDYGIKTKNNILDLKHSAEDFYLAAYSGNRSKASSILQGMQLDQEVLGYPVIEKEDHISWAAFDPDVIKKLLGKIKREKVDYLVLDGHDAYRPGAMIASHLNAKICAIRNSLDSGRDKELRPLTGENKYLYLNLAGKRVMAFGEDVSTGTAIKSLADFIGATSPSSKIITASCLKIPGSLLKIPLDYFGEEKKCFN